MGPLVRRWQVVKQSVLDALAAEPAATNGSPGKLKLNRPALDLLQAWAAEITRVRILDPACGSGNFLYIALKRLLDLWHEARVFGIEHGLALSLDPIPHPGQLFGIEIDFYAHEIASIVVWIGFLQWKRDHSIIDNKSPVLEKLSNIEHADAIMRYDAENKPYEPEWPQADYIVGNPPFLGDKKMRRELDIEPHQYYVDDLRKLYENRVPGGADLVTYWFEKARARIAASVTKRAGLIATQAIRGGANRTVLQRIKDSGNILWAQSNAVWLLNGASVRTSMIAFDDGSEGDRRLDGLAVYEIFANLTTGVDITDAQKLAENIDLSFIGTQKGGKFDLPEAVAGQMLRRPVNVNGRENADVVKPWMNGNDITDRPQRRYIVDFGTDLSREAASQYETPFSFVEQNVKPKRLSLRRSNHARLWWLHAETRPGMRKALEGKTRYIATPRVSKHRLFAWISAAAIPDSRLIAIAREDDYFFGALHSSLHESWSLATSSRHGVAGDITYNALSCFETFPFPWPPNREPSEADSPLVAAIASAARNLVELRDAWLNPPGISEVDLKKRTLTNLYNERQAGRATWLADAHRMLDEAVFAAYGWPANLTTSAILPVFSP